MGKYVFKILMFCIYGYKFLDLSVEGVNYFFLVSGIACKSLIHFTMKLKENPLDMKHRKKKKKKDNRGKKENKENLSVLPPSVSFDGLKTQFSTSFSISLIFDWILSQC